MAKTTPKDFFMWAGAMVAFYWSVVAFLALMFDYINYTLPNALSYIPADPYQSGISYEMASLIILFPVFVALMRLIRRDITKDPTRADIWVRRWALFLTLFIAGLSMAVDLVILLTSFLNGSDITSAFLLKVVVVFLVAAAAFMHFLADFWGYWNRFPSRAHTVGYGVGALVLISIIAGFFIVGTPQHARLMRLDAQKVSDLQSIQSQIVSYWQAKQALPQSLNDLNDPISGFSVPQDPQTNAQYEYETTGHNTFRLCAQFNAASTGSAYGVTPLGAPYGANPVAETWAHSSGRACFDRDIDPMRYPPLSK